MENNSENKLKFFAHYFGQRVLKNKNLNEPFNKDVIYDMFFDSYVNKNHKFFYLELRSIESITDAECVYYYNMFCPDLYIDDNLKIYAFKNRLNHILEYKLFNCLELQEIDWLRSKGFLLPFMNLTTDQILEFGWAKIKDK